MDIVWPQLMLIKDLHSRLFGGFRFQGSPVLEVGILVEFGGDGLQAEAFVFGVAGDAGGAKSAEHILVYAPEAELVIATGNFDFGEDRRVVAYQNGNVAVA